MTKRRIAVVVVDRANYGRLKPVMAGLRDEPSVELQVVCAGTTLLDRFGRSVDVIRSDGFEVRDEVFTELEGSVPATMAKSVGLAVIEFSSAFQRLQPDFVLLIGDRYEALAAATAAAYLNISLIHLQGGEVTGSIDESARHAITKLSHYHFPATERAGAYVLRMGERPDTVFPFGCPSVDVVDAAASSVDAEELMRLGVGPELDFQKPFILTLFHPVTTEYRSSESQMEEVLEALQASGQQILLIWPNIDAGSDGISQAIRRFREFNRDAQLHAYKNFEPEAYVPLLKRASCLVGNSSSFVRDASFLGTPVVLVGSRQDGRELSAAVRRVEPTAAEIGDAIRAQVEHGPYPSDGVYGQPGVSQRIVAQITELEPYSQKRLFFPEEPHAGL
jgi:UDP-hydrolysing UDP-N-acetyl-D-glucosamine 2-epimerase